MTTHGVPTIETPRLLLRAHVADDFEAFTAMWSDELVFRYTTGQASTPSRSWVRLMAYRGHWDLLGFGYWAIESKESRCFIGEMGFADFKREKNPDVAGVPEMGWVLAPAVHGRGLASEAALAVSDWGDRNLAADRTVCIIHSHNHPSLRIADKVGYRELRRTDDGTDGVEILFQRARRHSG